MAVNKDKYTQILVTFTKEQVEQIENYWHENKLKNRNEAIRQIVDGSVAKLEKI
ncbi:ribbon-helix-helix domain-containing protein [Bacillus mycoides]|uniref:ribbon-helix-helix domain-containing protein n=1 Tax=Bacillus mycoides TaxID=1405 RepID=UPI001C02118B|nr:ribbon-helix-helix domain-containing protein [Bacillus mycoides]